nr:Chromate resistance protein ChrB [uncultured Bradyrhizobium sp.]
MVRAQGGSATVFATTATSEEEEQTIVARFQSDRAREYDEFAERSGEFLAEIEKETRRRKFTFAELEEIEDDLDKLSAWLAKIKARDFFPNARMQQANETLETCSTALRTFADEVYAHEGVVDAAEGSTGSLDPDAPNSSLKKRGGPRHG